MGPNATIRFVHRADACNPGDLASCPANYFRFTEPVTVIDVREFATDPGKYPGPIVLGGGGLLRCTSFAPALLAIYRYVRHTGTPLVVWGAGYNTEQPFPHDAGSGRFTDRVKRFAERKRNERYARIITDQLLASAVVAGVRDTDPTAPLRHVPCVSCMHPSLTALASHPFQRECVVVDHSHRNRIPLQDVPRLSNRDSTVSELIAFVASARMIVTTSYHAAYWGALLGRVVVALGWSSKFRRISPDVFVGNNLPALLRKASKAAVPTKRLEASQDTNREFAACVSDHLGLGVGLISRELEGVG